MEIELHMSDRGIMTNSALADVRGHLRGHRSSWSCNSA